MASLDQLQMKNNGEIQEDDDLLRRAATLDLGSGVLNITYHNPKQKKLELVDNEAPQVHGTHPNNGYIRTASGAFHPIED